MSEASSMKKVCYVAGPLVSKGFPPTNTRRGILAQLELMKAGIAAFCPHCSYFADFLVDDPPSYSMWIDLDFCILQRCDCLLRLPGESPGADREIAVAQANGIPVFYTVSDVINWSRDE